MKKSITVLTALLLVLVVSSGALAAKGFLTGADIKNGSLAGADIKKRSLGPALFTASTKRSLRGVAGTDGAQGFVGPAGSAGLAGANGAPGVNGAPGANGVAGNGTDGTDGDGTDGTDGTTDGNRHTAFSHHRNNSPPTHWSADRHRLTGRSGGRQICRPGEDAALPKWCWRRHRVRAKGEQHVD